MGFFSNLISKQKCELCEKEVGALSRTKLSDGTYICSDCRKDTSAFIAVSRYTIDEIRKHIEYMKKQNEFYENVFSKLSDNELVKCIKIGYPSIIFADSIGMFEIINSDTKKKNYKELFRYDQIKDFEVYTKKNTATGDNQKKYSETGVKIIMDSAVDIANFAANDDEKRHLHPYAKEFILPISRNVDNKDGGMIEKHLNEIFGRPNGKFMGIESQKTNYQIANDVVNAITDKVMGKKDVSINTTAKFIPENKIGYGNLADEAEKSYMKETFRDFLYK